MNSAFSLPANVAPRGLPPVAETLPAAIERLVREVNPEKIILFGSYAYGNPTPDSDVDLLIIWDTDKPRRERVVTISLLLYPRLFPVDIMVKTPRELAEEAPHNFFLQEILSRGIVVYERQ
ncbi:nucleotidyltransferase domain-containing protein [Roseiflexus castenholzii]|jgi:predicted nucleotidyltransferase|uniref:DNA polymerase beta domain protein region n=1 Tax=Roseiflexus castenholzii (strain DSM 13941 / HLO8) TaxID=383372 RepID=A7NGV6_ROSCS|nr:nucleotidyltransferase domain-containing protein [Roseiflexus castenholzii]ABU56703.1 DNA polymerase beta domain protein region [Roseiflexus castenholzii DSM 13941]